MPRLPLALTSTLFTTITLAPLLASQAARAVDLPYTARTRPYSGFGTTVRGDIRTVGMAGAMVGLADTFIASTLNPAGLAMTLKEADSNFASNTIHDGNLQSFESPVTVNNVGAAVAPYPWGISLGYTSPFREGQEYAISGNPTRLGVTTRDLRAGVARTLFDNRLALGMTMNFGQAELELQSPTTPQPGMAYHAYALGATLGALYQLPNRLLLGASYSLPMHFAVDGASEPTPDLPGFYEPVYTPEILAIGMGWIPNRYFRADFSTILIGRTPETALLGDQSRRVGEFRTLQPRVGAAYVFADYKELQGTLFGGAYYETPRLSELPGRAHLTAGVELKPWIVTLGWGIDTAREYRNYLVSVGVDLIKVMQKLELVPRGSGVAQNRFFPRPSQLSDEGLARPLVRNWRPGGPPVDAIRAGLELPSKIQQKIESAGEAIQGVFSSPDGEPDRKPAAKPAGKSPAKKNKKRQPPDA